MARLVEAEERYTEHMGFKPLIDDCHFVLHLCYLIPETLAASLAQERH